MVGLACPPAHPRWSTQMTEAYREGVTGHHRVHDVTPAVRLRSVEDRDLDVFFDHQADPQAVEMAAFPARDKDQFAAHWAKVRADDTVVVRTIVADGMVAGNIGCWQENARS